MKGTLRSAAMWGVAAFVGVLVAALVLTVTHGWRGNAAAPASTTHRPSRFFHLHGFPAPNFTLRDQFGRPTSLAAYRGREVVLTFVDAKCTTVCPLTAQEIRDAREHLSPNAAGKVAVLAVNANPIVRSISATRQWSVQHHMLHQWRFLTGSKHQLKNVYYQYAIRDTVSKSGAVTHNAAIYIIDARGRERLYTETMPTKQQTFVSVQESTLVSGMKQWLPRT